jgi:hypothetical protein
LKAYLLYDRKNGARSAWNNILHCVIYRKKYSDSKSVFMSYNVPAVYDGFASPIKETVGFQGLQNCGGGLPWE